MLDKDRQRHRQSPAPQGRMPNWLLVAVALTLAVLLARVLAI
jgi:hypothetical protein